MTVAEAVTDDRFTDEEVEAFRRDGYLVLRQLAEPDLRERMLAATLDGLARETPPIEYEAELSYPGAPESIDAAGGRTARRLKAAHSRGIAFTEWVTWPPLLDRLRQLLGGPVVMPLAHHNCVMTKQPRFSSDTGWHQDIRYWSFTRPDLVNVWLALGPERRENGCLRVIHGSHTQPLDRHRFDEQVFFRADLPENAPLLDRAIDVELEPGDVLFFHARTLHAATRNYSDRPKFSVVFTFRPLDNPPRPGTRSAAMPEMLLG
jgi:phytanoyl-CoA hydroxylase